MNHANAVNNVEWALQEAYKMAVHMRGITDWSKVNDKVEENKLIEDYQLKIAEMIITSLFSDFQIRTT